jgi:hypothetical protein
MVTGKAGDFLLRHKLNDDSGPPSFGFVQAHAWFASALYDIGQESKARAQYVSSVTVIPRLLFSLYTNMRCLKSCAYHRRGSFSFERLLGCRSRLGLLSEHVDPETGCVHLPPLICIGRPIF